MYVLWIAGYIGFHLCPVISITTTICAYFTRAMVAITYQIPGRHGSEMQIAQQN